MCQRLGRSKLGQSKSGQSGHRYKGRVGVAISEKPPSDRHDKNRKK